jgi:hypothetical protein
MVIAVEVIINKSLITWISHTQQDANTILKLYYTASTNYPTACLLKGLWTPALSQCSEATTGLSNDKITIPQMHEQVFRISD